MGHIKKKYWKKINSLTEVRQKDKKGHRLIERKKERKKENV